MMNSARNLIRSFLEEIMNSSPNLPALGLFIRILKSVKTLSNLLQKFAVLIQ